MRIVLKDEGDNHGVGLHRAGDEDHEQEVLYC